MTRCALEFKHLAVLFLLLLILPACALTGVPAGSPVPPDPSTLVVSLQCTSPEKVIGAIDVTIETPPGVAVAAQANGLIEGGVLAASIDSKRVFMTGKFTGTTLRAALISPEAFGHGEVLQIRLKPGSAPASAESYRVRTLNVVDLNGKPVNGVSAALAVR